MAARAHTRQVRDPVVVVVVAIGSALVVLFVAAGVVLAVGKQVPTELWAAASALSGALVGMLVPPGDPAAAVTAAHAAHAKVRDQAVSAAQDSASVLADAARRPDASDDDKVAAAAAARAVDEVRTLASTPVNIELATRPEAATPTAAAAAAAAGMLGDLQRTTAQGAEELPANPAAAAAPQTPAEVTARRKVLQAAVSGAADAQVDAVTTGKNAAASTQGGLGKLLGWGGDPKVVLALLVGVIALGVGIWLALKTGKDTSSAVTQYDTAVMNVANTLIALGSAAVGAALGLKTPTPGKSQDG